jgi:hypothetical protein
MVGGLLDKLFSQMVVTQQDKMMKNESQFFKTDFFSVIFTLNLKL